MWRFIAWPRLNLPVAVLWNRFAAPRCVFLFVAMFGAPSSLSLISVLLDRAENLVHPVSHHLGAGLGMGPSLEVLDEPVENFPPVVEARHLAAAELDGGLHLVALLQEPEDVLQLEVVIVLVDVRPELDFLDLGDLLLLLAFVLFLLLLERELAEVHDLADRGIGLLSDHHDVEPFLARFRDGGRWIDDTELGSVRADQPDLLKPEDEFVDRGVLRRGNAWAASEKCDGEFLLISASGWLMGFGALGFS